MSKNFFNNLNENLEALKSAGLFKSERIITSRQAGNISVLPGNNVLNFCANNYLGLADNAELIEAGKNALDKKKVTEWPLCVSSAVPRMCIKSWN